MLRAFLVALVLAPLACGPGDPGATDGSTGGGSSASTGGGSGSTAAATTDDPTSGGSGTATASTSTTAATTTGPSTTTTTGETTAAASTGVSATSSSTGDTGGPSVCEAAEGDYGDCATPLGWAFDGTECAMVSGCDCAPDCDRFFADAAACALACAAAGHCNADRLHGAALAMDPVQQGQLCDEVDVCVPDDSYKSIYEQIFGMLTCEGQGFPCEGNAPGCTGLWQNMLGPEEWLKTCAATLVQGGGDVFCVVFGP